jgi:hypothetical protein
MPSCNLAETIHNKWFQVSGNSGGDLYVATVDDFVQGFLQVVNYYQFLKGDIGGTCLTKKKLKLRMAERRAKQTGNPLVLEDPMLDMLGAEEFGTRVPRMAGEEVFGSTKRKENLPLRAEEESHRPDKVNFSHPRGPRRAVRARPVQIRNPSFLKILKMIRTSKKFIPLRLSLRASMCPHRMRGGGNVMSMLSKRQRLTSRSDTY